MIMRKKYLAPRVKIVEVLVENGFAHSAGGVRLDGNYINDWEENTLIYEGEAVEDNSDFWN